MIKKIITLTISIILIISIISPVSATGKIKINKILINDPSSFAQTIDSENNMILFQNTDYQIVYMPKFNHEFLIDIKSDNFDQSTKDSFSKLGELLGIDDNDLCWMYIIITSSNKEDANNFAKNYEPAQCNDHRSRRKRDKSTDINKDGVTNSLDYAFVLRRYSTFSEEEISDINGDKIVNALDVSLIFNNLGENTTDNPQL